jgi:hypothetical protein
MRIYFLLKQINTLIDKGFSVNKAVKNVFYKNKINIRENVLMNFVEAVKSDSWLSFFNISFKKEDIKAAYNSSFINSCMTGKGKLVSEFYHKNGAGIATITRGNDIVARCLVDDDCFAPKVYGNEWFILEAILVVEYYGKETKDNYWYNKYSSFQSIKKFIKEEIRVNFEGRKSQYNWSFETIVHNFTVVATKTEEFKPYIDGYCY